MAEFFLSSSSDTCHRTLTTGVLLLFLTCCCNAFSVKSVFNGQPLESSHCQQHPLHHRHRHKCLLTMRKQKASDRRTRRRQRGIMAEVVETKNNLKKETTTTPVTTLLTTTTTTSPMQQAGPWKHKKASTSRSLAQQQQQQKRSTKSGGRGRSRKRSTLYNCLAFYYNHFWELLTLEYQAEEEEVLGRIKASADDPLGLESTSGYALFDLLAQRRGNLFSDEVYRLTKAPDATTTYTRSVVQEEESSHENDNKSNNNNVRYLPPNHKFCKNDVIVLTLQPNGSGDFFGPLTLPTNENAVSVEARVLNMGPTYVDVALAAGTFEAAFGGGQSSHQSMRLRADRFVSNVPYQRMVTALGQLTTIPDRPKRSNNAAKDGKEKNRNHDDNICMDELIRKAILSTHAFTDPHSPLLRDSDVCNVQELANKLSKPPMVTSHKLASQVMKYIQTNPKNLFPKFNASQRAAIEAALTRRMTLIQGPPGTGKTTVAAAIAFGFVHQCRNCSSSSSSSSSNAQKYPKVLACALSNVGADNLAEACLRLGLRVVRIGKPSAVSESLWDYTLEAAIDRDAEAQKAARNAARATAQLCKLTNRKRSSSSSRRASNSGSGALSERTIRDAATAAVKASIEASNIAATKALREADVIVSTSVGAADPRLMAACGLLTGEADGQGSADLKERYSASSSRENAPDNLPPLSLPFVIIDEACQSVEPATLVPVVSSNSCRSLVMLGDPCQLPATVKSRLAAPLSLSLMERLSATLPHPLVSSSVDNTIKDTTFIDTLPIKQAKSLFRSMEREPTQRSYRKRFGGALLLSIQYRMHPSIAAFSSALFYDEQLLTPSFMAEKRFFPNVLNKLMPCGNPDICVRAIDVGGRFNERRGPPTRYSGTVFSSKPSAYSLEEQTTYWNEPEAERVISLIKDILRDKEAAQVNSIGVISPYNGQVQLIKSMIASDSELRDLLLKLPTTIEVKSVDGYQGRERDIIIFSAVRSNRQGRIGFLHDWRRMNVALTRAKSAVLFVGDLETLAEADKHWAAFAKWASASRCVVDDFDSPEDEPSH